MLTEGLGCSPEAGFGIFNQAKNGEVTFIEAERMLTKLYQDSGKANKSIIKSIFDKVVVKEEAIELINYLKEKGYFIYLISGGINIYVESVANKVGANGFYANSSLEFDDKEILEKINYRENQGEVKVEQVNDLIKKTGIDISQVVFVGDSENDIEVFQETGKGIAVNSNNEKLKEVAWKTVDSLLEIKNSL